MRFLKTLSGIATCLAFSGVFQAAVASPGFIVAAPDRGFMGNEESRDAFKLLASRYPAELVFITDERGQVYFNAAVERLEERDAERVVVLPLYLSDKHPDFATLREYIGESELPVDLTRHFGASATATVALSERLRNAPAGRISIVGTPPENEEDAAAMQADLERLVDAVRAEFPQHELSAATWVMDDGFASMKQAMGELPEGSQVMPFHLGQKLSSMMAFSAYLDYVAPEGVSVIDGEVTPHDAIGAWMLREARRASEIPDNRLGVVVHAHGSDFHWNETMRNAAAPLAEDYLVEYAFSMGDPATLERAIRNLEQRGAEAVVIVRVFGREKSFLAGIERFIGTDYELCRAESGHGGHSHSSSPARLLTTLPVATVGGLEAHPLFAKALLDRAEALSSDAANETVILVAHGVGDDKRNEGWLRVLAALREQMLAEGGDDFRAMHIATWREDWPDKREAAIEHVRELVEQGNANGGRTIIIPARTTEQGPAHELLPDMEFELGSGFAPHPLFVEWLREQVNQGVRELRAESACD